MRVAVVYDCLFPHSIGGAERWYRNLAERLAAAGHEVTYLTMRQWEPGTTPDAPAGVEVVAVAPRMALYTATGRRRILPPLVFGAGVKLHLLRNGRRYDVVHTASFPFFSLLAAGAWRRALGYRLIVDWHEVWTREYWHEYLGRLGFAGAAIQRVCARFRQTAFCFSELHADRLRGEGLRGEVTVLRGEWAGDAPDPVPAPAGDPPTVVFAGRLIPEKNAAAIPPAVAIAGERIPQLHALVFGDGPRSGELREAIARAGVGDRVLAPGFVDTARVEAALREALCMVLPSVREGYGMVVVESASRGTPVVVAAAPDNAAVELVEPGVNGFIATTPDPSDLAAAIAAVHDAGAALRESTCEWFARNRSELSIDASLAKVLERYR